MIADATKLKATIIQAIQEINDGCKDLRDEGLQVMLPEAVDFEVQVVTDINAVTRTQTESESDGSTVSLTEQLANDVQTVSGTDLTEQLANDVQTVSGTDLTEQLANDVQTVSGTDLTEQLANDVQTVSGTSLTEQLANDIQTATKTGDNVMIVRTPTSGSETTTITHPSVQTENSGGDDTDETVTYDYE